MIASLTRHYRRMPRIGKFLFGIVFLLGIFLATFRTIRADSLPFESQLTGIFPWLNTGYYSNTRFKYGGNNFIGIIFRQTGETLSVPETLTISGGTQSIQCSKKLRGIYYNNQRGRMIWPLDTGNLALLSGSTYASGYDIMTMTGGFYTNCTGVSGYSPATNEVYGQITHTLFSTQYHMFAGLSYDFTGNTISGNIFDHTLKISTGNIHTGFMFDTHGGIAELDMNMPRCQDFISSPSLPPIIIPYENNMTFTCYGQNVSGYILNIFLSGGTSPTRTNQQWTNANSYTRITGSALATGDYIATCTVFGPGGSGPQCGTNISFRIGSGSLPPSGSGCNPNFQGEITFASYNGSIIINPSLGSYYTNSTGIVLQRAATEPTSFAISGDFTASVFSGIYTGTDIFNHLGMANIILTKTNAWNNFVSTYITGSCTYVDAAKRVYVDTLPPTAPSITAPATGTANVCPSLPLTITRNASTDTGSQIAHYKYEIYNNSGMTTGLVFSGTTSATSVNVNISALPLGTYYLRVIALDNVGLSTPSAIVSLNNSAQYCTAGTGIVIVTPTIRIRNAEPHRVYRSDPIWILGLTGPTLVSIDKGMLFINNITGGNGTTGLVTSNDTLYIELISSDTYNTTVTSTLSIAGLTGTFSITTRDNLCDLSAAEKLIIQNIYNNLKNTYNNNMSLFADFMNTFYNMVEDESEISANCSLNYLLELIQNDFGTQGVNTSNHITPNCKEYRIEYDINEKAYYSPDMMNKYYFINRESLIRHLDFYNPGDCHINTYGNDYRTTINTDPMYHVAPNGKIYHLIGQYGGFTAKEFIVPKYFDSLQGIKTYIDLKNPATTIWKHTIDTSFFPIVYAAPNGKEYKIYKTDRGYMSYKLMKVQYFPSLGELKSYIDKNNPSKR